MADDTSAALKALIQQVSALTETVAKQDKRLENLHEFNGRVLDQKKTCNAASNSRPRRTSNWPTWAMSAPLTATTTPKGPSPLTP
ncbi:hypothetical protein [Aliiroseovarius marinus]|uniref:hypothetical protein n=1 Tax=Aliiroseovarius marinus TaxID=2500159 RepID=UPI003D7E6E06